MIRTLIAIGAALLIAGCDSQESLATDTKLSPEAMNTELKSGGVYASKNDEGKFTITKILVLDEFAVHARFYNEKFDKSPSEISTKNLTSLIGHAPMSRKGFLKDGQELIANEDVSDDELQGYTLYLESMRDQ